MRKQKKDNLLSFLLALVFIGLCILFPELKIEMIGGFAWTFVMVVFAMSVVFISVFIFGYSATLESKGLIGWIKQWKNKS